MLLTAAIIIFFFFRRDMTNNYVILVHPAHPAPAHPLQHPSVLIANAGAVIAIIIFFDDDGIAWKPFHVEMGVWDISKMTFWTTNI